MKIIISSYLTIITTLLVLTTIPSSESYTNHTVGETSGWYFNRSSNSSITNYSKWASDKTFNLGDYLIFNTNTNQTVIQTYNETAYKICNADDTVDTDASVYSGGDEIGKQVSLSVALTIEGENYFFSGADDGAQCQKGMSFEIVVKHGVGLPPSLNQPPPPPFVDSPPSDPSSIPSDTSTSPQTERVFNGGESGRIMGMQHIGVVVSFVLFGSLVL